MSLGCAGQRGKYVYGRSVCLYCSVLVSATTFRVCCAFEAIISLCYIILVTPQGSIHIPTIIRSSNEVCEWRFGASAEGLVVNHV
jgi:hypothetical protein